jgi:hypothetical protein
MANKNFYANLNLAALDQIAFFFARVYDYVCNGHYFTTA